MVNYLLDDVPLTDLHSYGHYTKHACEVHTVYKLSKIDGQYLQLLHTSVHVLPSTIICFTWKSSPGTLLLMALLASPSTCISIR